MNLSSFAFYCTLTRLWDQILIRVSCNKSSKSQNVSLSVCNKVHTCYYAVIRVFELKWLILFMMLMIFLCLRDFLLWQQIYKIQCRSVYRFIMSFIKVLICSEYAIEARCNCEAKYHHKVMLEYQIHSLWVDMDLYIFWLELCLQ